MKLHLPCLLRRAVVRALFAAATVVTTLASSTYADMITPDGRTATQVIQSGNVYDVYTNTVRGNTGFNSFSTFDVYAETTANLHLADGTGRLINVVRDSASHIDGVLNSYKDGSIGGDVYFLNPNGIIVGKTGIINVGSISMSTPTAAFVEQLIARDGSISATATQAVLAGDMPINEKGTISIKGKVNAARSAEIRAGKVEVKGGEVNTSVKLSEMVNTGGRKVDTQGMSIQDGKLSFGATPAREGKAAEPEAKPEVEPVEEATAGLADISIFADSVLVDGGFLNADSVYLAPDELTLEQTYISGDYKVEARKIDLTGLSVEQGKTLTSFTLTANNARTTEGGESDVSITLSNSTFEADVVSITANATMKDAHASITLINNDITTTRAEGCSLSVSATSATGDAKVDIQSSNTLDSKGSALISALAKSSGGTKEQPTGGNAEVTVDGKVKAEGGALTVTAGAKGSSGNAKITITGKLTSNGTASKKVGELAITRNPDETVNEGDNPDQVNDKNGKFMKRFADYLGGLIKQKAAIGTIKIAAISEKGDASVTQSGGSAMESSLSAAISAEAEKNASITLAGNTTSGNIRVTTKGDADSKLLVDGENGNKAILRANPYKTFVQDGTTVSLESGEGDITLEAGKRSGQLHEVDRQENVLLQVGNAKLDASRDKDVKEWFAKAGSISLVSAGDLKVARETAKVHAYAATMTGTGGSIYLDAPVYDIWYQAEGESDPIFDVRGRFLNGTVWLMNHTVLKDLNSVDSIVDKFIILTLNGVKNVLPEDWSSGFVRMEIEDDISLNGDVEVSVHEFEIGGDINGNEYSLTINNNGWNHLSPTNQGTFEDGVTITDMEDFTIEFLKEDLAIPRDVAPAFSSTSLSVGDNFTLEAGGDVTLTVEGIGKTSIEFGENLNLKAAGDVTISATTVNGWRGTLGNAPSMELMNTYAGQEFGTIESAVNEAFEEVETFNFNEDAFFQNLFSGELGKNLQASPKFEARGSLASVTFHDENAGRIEANTVTITSASNVNVSSGQNTPNDGASPLALSTGFIFNSSKIDLGKNLIITATGSTVPDEDEDKVYTSVTISSSTNSKLSLTNEFNSVHSNNAIGVLVVGGLDFNTVNIDKSVTITAPKDINIITQSNIETKPTLSLRGNVAEQIETPGNGGEDPTPAPIPVSGTNNYLLFGLDLLVHKSDTTINGTLTSKDGNISMQSLDNINSALSMNGSIQYRLPQTKLTTTDESQELLQSLWNALQDSMEFDLAVSQMDLGDDIAGYTEEDGLGSILDTGDGFLRSLGDNPPEQKRCIALSVAADVVITGNTLTFGGTAKAKGDITLNASSAIEAACGAETSIVSVPTQQAIMGSISVPVVIGSTTVEIGGEDPEDIGYSNPLNPILEAGGNISVSSSTSLPMSFDFMGWNGWAKFVKASGLSKAGEFFSALKGTFSFIEQYKDKGDFGLLETLTSSHASSLIASTDASGDGKAGGGDLVVDVRHLNTQTIIGDGAVLKAGGLISATSSSTGTQVSFAGQLPVFLSLGSASPSFLPRGKEASGFGGSVVVGEKTFNTVTSIGAATLEANQLVVDSTGDAFMLEMSLAGSFGSAKNNSVQGGVNVIVENRTTVSEVSGGATITLHGSGEKAGSSITATDKGTLLNITGMETDAGKVAVGAGVAVTINKGLTAAMLGNEGTIDDALARAGVVTLNFTGDAGLTVDAQNKGTIVSVGVAGAVQTSGEKEENEQPDETDGSLGDGLATVAANVGVLYGKTEVTARQISVIGTGNAGMNNVSTLASDTTTIVSVAGDAAVAAARGTAAGAGAVSVNRLVMDTTAHATDCDYSGIGAFKVDASDKATVVAVDAAAAVGAVKANIAAGSAWNSLTGNTGAYLTGGTVNAGSVSVTSLTDLTSLSVTLGTGVGFRNDAANGENNGEQPFSPTDAILFDRKDTTLDNAVGSIIQKTQTENESTKLESYLEKEHINKSKTNEEDTTLPEDSLGIDEDFPDHLDGGAANVGVTAGASIARNSMDMHSSAIVEGCRVTTPGEFKVTAEDTSVITAVSVGAAVGYPELAAAGGVFSFAPVSSTTEAAIRQRKDVVGKLGIQAGSLTLHATDNHRERVWSFGVGGAATANIGLVLSWGSFAGSSTKALIENVDATVRDAVDILASSTLDTTYISVGGAAGKGLAAVTGMINYMNFNNRVVTDIEGSTLTVTSADGKFNAVSKGKRTFTDGVGALSFSLSPGACAGAAVSFVYLGGNGKDDTNLTQLKVNNSFINNSGTTSLWADSFTKGILAGANGGFKTGVGADMNAGFSWVSDATITQVDITDTYFNQRKAESDKNAKITVDATSSSDLTIGFGTLAVQIGLGGAVGAGVAVIKDNATTTATMTGGGVGSARDFSLSATGKADLSGLILGVAGSSVGIGGGAFAATITHTVTSKLDDSVMNLEGALTIKADNTSNVGKDSKTRFTVANGAGSKFATLGAAVSYILVQDHVLANANNVSVHSGSMKVEANERNSADAVTVNLAASLFGAGNASVVLPVLDGEAVSSVTSTKVKTSDGTAVGITTTGDMTVAATNNQWLRSHLWAFSLAANPKLISAAASICVNQINMAGAAKALVQGEMPLTLGGNLNVTALTDRTADYTTVPVTVTTGLAIGVDVNIMRVSNDTSQPAPAKNENENELDGDPIDPKAMAVEAIGVNINEACDLFENLALMPGTAAVDSKPLLDGGVRTAMDDVAKRISQPSAPETSAVVDLGGAAAQVDGNITIKAKDTITTTPSTVFVTGGLLVVAPHINMTTLDGTVRAGVNGGTLIAGGDITIDAEQKHGDSFKNVAVAVAAASIPVGVYEWTDSATTKTELAEGTHLVSKNGSVKVATHSDTSEKFKHVNTNVGLGSVALLFPSFQQNDHNILTIGNGVEIEAAKDVSIGTNSVCNFTASTYDIALSGIKISVEVGTIGLTTEQSLTTGEGVAITGDTVEILQNANRTTTIIEDHIGVTGLSLSFPFLRITDTVTSTLGIGNGNIITARAGALTIDSFVKVNTNLSFLGVNAVPGLAVEYAKNSYDEKITNNTKLGDDVQLHGANGAMTVRARSEHTGNMKGYNITASAVASDILTTFNNGNVTNAVTIGTRFVAWGKSLTLEALSTDVYLCNAEKVTVSLLLSPYSRNAFDTNGTSTATITLAGGDINVQEFNANAKTDVTAKVRQILGGGSVTVDVNKGNVKNEITQTATVTLGTDNNELNIITDNIRVTSHNKYLFERLDPQSDTMVSGGNIGLLSGTSDGTVDTEQKLDSKVTLGAFTKVKRRADVEHYFNKEKYKALFSATNNVESNSSIHLFSGGLLNANCKLTTTDKTTAHATLDINGSIDTWGDTELTAYSHARHQMQNLVESGAIIPTFTSKVTNHINTVDTVNINGTVESIGNITIQGGSVTGWYTLVDGDTVIAGDSDTNTTIFSWGKSKDGDIIHNRRTEAVNINAGVRAGGELAIYNDSSAYTTKKPFTPTGTSVDYTNAANNTAADVSSTITLGENAKLYAGLGSAIKMAFPDNTPTLLFTSAQCIFADSIAQEQDGTWRAPDSAASQLYAVLRPNGNDTCLVINPLTLPGMAFRIVSKATQDSFKGKLFSPDKHGLDIFVSSGWSGHVVTTGVTLRGHESGLFYNNEAVDGIVEACATTKLSRSEGVSIRNQASGNLYIAGLYQFPYNTFVATSDHDLVVLGEVCCGVSQFAAGGSFILSNSEKDYAMRGTLSMYRTLFAEMDAEFAKMRQDKVNQIAKDSGNGGNGKKNGVYNSNYTWDKRTFTPDEILSKVQEAIKETGEATIKAMGTVSIEAKVLDLNGKIYSGYANLTNDSNTITIDTNFKVLDPNGTTISLHDAQQLYRESVHTDQPIKTFRLAGYTGLSLVYDAERNDITLSGYESQPSGITLTGAIVNSNPIAGAAGLYVAGTTAPLTVDNKSGLLLNIGDIHLQKMTSSGITLINTDTQVTTTYTVDDGGQWVKKEKRNNVTTDCGTVTGSDSYTGLADYMVKLERTIKTPVEERGRLAFEWHPYDGPKKGDKWTGDDGLLGNKHTLIDGIEIKHSNAEVPQPLASSYIKNNGSLVSGRVIVENTLVPHEKTVETLTNPALLERIIYALTYVETSHETLYIQAKNPVAINLGSTDGSLMGLTVTSGSVNFIGTVLAPNCTVNAGHDITATAVARVNCGNIYMNSAEGSIGTAAQALTFNADTASFSAKKNLYLATQQDIGKLTLAAGLSLEQHSDANIKALDMKAFVSALVDAKGDIIVTNGSIGDKANKSQARVTLRSEDGRIEVQPGADFTTGIITAEAGKDIEITSTIPKGAITLDYVESRNGNVTISAKGDICTIRGADLSNPAGFDSTIYSLDLKRGDLAEDYYAMLLRYEELYYHKDKNGNYDYRDGNGNLALPEAQKTKEELCETVLDLYSTGRGDYLGGIMVKISGTAAVDGTQFKSEADALVYLAQHGEPDRLRQYALTYYDRLMADITAEIKQIHVVAPDNIDYGPFSEETYRLYWARDCDGNYVNRDADGNFISPLRTQDTPIASTDPDEPVYSAEMCRAITSQFGKQIPVSGGSFTTANSATLKNLASGMNGSRTASVQLSQLEDGLSSLFSGKPAGEVQTTVRAANGSVTLTADPEYSIGGEGFHFTVMPIGKNPNGTFKYSDWVNRFFKSSTVTVARLSENPVTGECHYSIDYLDISTTDTSINLAQYVFLQQALPTDVFATSEHSVRAVLRNCVGIDAPKVNLMGDTVLVHIAGNGELELGDANISANNLYLSTTAKVVGALNNTGKGIVSINADGGIGDASTAFGISGNSTFTLGSTADVFVKVQGDVNIGSISGRNVNIDASGGKLIPTSADKNPKSRSRRIDIVGQRIDYTGDLDTGLNIRTTGLSQDKGGLHWHGGKSGGDLKFNALNKAYTFWFVREGEPIQLNSIDIGYSGYVCFVNLPIALTSTSFRQINTSAGANILAFKEMQTFGKLAFSGEGSYTIQMPDVLTLGGDATLELGGDATLELAGIRSADGRAIHINSTGNLAITPCNVENELVVDSTGKIALDEVSVAGPLTLNGRRGISGADVSARKIVANSSNGGVFLNADTEDLSGSSRNSFVADLECLGNGTTVNVHDITAHAKTARVVIRSLSNELELGGTISGAALLFYSTGDILKDAKDILDSDYPFLDIWHSNDPEVAKMNMEQFRADLTESFVWLIEESSDDAAQESKDVQRLRRMLDGEDEIPTVPALRFTDKDGNTVSREQYANLITTIK